jgi:hypothetical protein
MNDWLGVAIVVSVVGFVVAMKAIERWIDRRADELFLQAQGIALDAAHSHGAQAGTAERRCPACYGVVTVSERQTGVPDALPVLEVRCECGLCDISVCVKAPDDDEVK